VGGGPAGAAAAIAALRAGARVEIYEQLPAPRHKVCGEFLCADALPVLERLGVLDRFMRARPARIQRLIVHVGSCVRQARLSAPAWGLSRYQLDRILLEHAAALGARVIAERRTPEGGDVDATGRPGPGGQALPAAMQEWRDRLRDVGLDRFLGRARQGQTGVPNFSGRYGFKAHFRGHVAGTAEMFFFHDGCVGVSPVEDGLATVCGLVRGYTLKDKDWKPENLLHSRPDVSACIRPLSRASDWLFAGPVTYADEPDFHRAGPYRAGDALDGVDPLTGWGMVNALASGEMAGIAAARGTPVKAYLQEAERVLGWPFVFGSAVVGALDTGWARILAPVVPVAWLYRITRPSKAGAYSCMSIR
jgi:menaquinone-9 beta-reductase